MAQVILIGDTWYSDLRIRCTGRDCPTPNKAGAHSHRIRKALSTNKAIAQKRLADFIDLQLAKRRGYEVGANASWSLFKNRFMEYSQSKDPQTHYRDTLAIRYLEGEFTIDKVSDVTVDLMERLKGRLKTAGKNAWNINRVLSALKAMMRMAETWGYAEPHDWRKVRRFKTPKGRLLFWTQEQCQKVYAAAESWTTVMYLAILAGLRRGEIRALLWENVDFARNRIHVVANDEWIPKDYERRWIPMKPELREHLERLPRRGRHVLGTPPPTLGSLTTYVRRILKKANVPGSLHTGRHTYAAHLAMAGVPLAVIKERMGHASIETTEIYAHLCPEAMADKYVA